MTLLPLFLSPQCRTAVSTTKPFWRWFWLQAFLVYHIITCTFERTSFVHFQLALPILLSSANHITNECVLFPDHIMFRSAGWSVTLICV